MLCYHVFLLHRVFSHGPKRESFFCDVNIPGKVYHLYWRFLSCAMFLFRGQIALARRLQTLKGYYKHVIRLFSLKQRKNFAMNVYVLCKLCEEVFGPSSYTPNLHSLHPMIRSLTILKGHPTFEMIVEHLVSIKNTLSPRGR